MADYIYPTGSITFGARDALAPADPEKVVKGSQLDAEFQGIAAASATKFDDDSTIDGGTYP